jgi:asparagine synthase (glutamine-hydrolysing)
MCGIAGWLGNLENAEHNSKVMARLLHHRGPDAQAVMSWPDATLIHTRLSIIDLSPTGAQPMPNEDGTVWTVFNGEIYNHSELRRSLETRGHLFRGHSDTEVLTHLYEEEGPSFVKRLRGMFALAIYDVRKRRLVLARDRFGIKPIFYALSPGCFAFSSELRPLKQLPFVDLRPDRQAVFDFAALFYIPSPETFYTGIRSIEPGQVLEISFSEGLISVKKEIYHRWSVVPDFGLTLDEAVERAESLVKTAVTNQLQSDVALGALLSGGIDSSLVSTAAQTAMNGGLHTFNVRFSDQEYDETWAAVAVAKHIRSSHQILEMDGISGSWDHITSLLRQAGQPFADTSLFAVNAVCQLMRKHVTVALSGDGGDEGFGGYNCYWQVQRIAGLQLFSPSIWDTAAIAMLPLARTGIIRTSLPERVRDLASADDVGIAQSMFCWLREEEHRRLCIDRDLEPVRRLFNSQWDQSLHGASRLERLSALTTEANVRLTLPNDFLFKVDTASMKESLEVRVPMLDEDLFAFGLSLPHGLKVKARKGKRVLRGVAERWLPEDVAHKPKQGFGIPVDRWVDERFRRHLRYTLLDSDSGLDVYFAPEVYTPLLEAFCDGRQLPGISRQGLYQRAIMLLSVHLHCN